MSTCSFLHGQIKENIETQAWDSLFSPDTIPKIYFTLNDCEKLTYYDSVVHKSEPNMNSTGIRRIISDLEKITKRTHRKAPDISSFFIVTYKMPKDCDADIRDWAKILGCDTSKFHYFNKEYVDSLNQVNERLLKTPNNYQLLIRKADMELKLKDLDSAFKNYDNAIKLDSLNPLAYYKMGIAWYQLGTISRACDNFKKAEKLGYKLTDEIKKYCLNSK